MCATHVISRKMFLYTVFHYPLIPLAYIIHHNTSMRWYISPMRRRIPISGHGRHLIALIDTEGGKTNPLREVTFLFVGVASSLPARVGETPRFSVCDAFTAPSIAFWGRGGHGRPERNDHSLTENIFPVIDFMMHEHVCDNILLCAWGASHDAAVLRDFTSGCLWPCGWIDLLAWARLVSGNSLPGYSIDRLLTRYAPTLARRQTHTSLLDTLDMLLVVSGVWKQFGDHTTKREALGDPANATVQTKGPISSLFSLISSPDIGECFLVRTQALERIDDTRPELQPDGVADNDKKGRGRHLSRSGNTAKVKRRPRLSTLVDAYARKRPVSRSRSADSSPWLSSASSFYSKEDGLLSFILGGGQHIKNSMSSVRAQGDALSDVTPSSPPASEVVDFPGQAGSRKRVEYFSAGGNKYRVRRGWRRNRHTMFRGFALYRCTHNGTWRACAREEKLKILIGVVGKIST